MLLVQRYEDGGLTPNFSAFFSFFLYDSRNFGGSLRNFGGSLWKFGGCLWIFPMPENVQVTQGIFLSGWLSVWCVFFVDGVCDNCDNCDNVFFALRQKNRIVNICDLNIYSIIIYNLFIIISIIHLLSSLEVRKNECPNCHYCHTAVW